jgi:hypothetical protein
MESELVERLNAGRERARKAAFEEEALQKAKSRQAPHSVSSPPAVHAAVRVSALSACMAAAPGMIERLTPAGAGRVGRRQALATKAPSAARFAGGCAPSRTPRWLRHVA